MKGIYRCWAEIDRSALRHNAKIVRHRVGSAEVLAVVKADAYGHGLVGVAEALADEAQLFGVANLEEALAQIPPGEDEGRDEFPRGGHSAGEQRGHFNRDHRGPRGPRK